MRVLVVDDHPEVLEVVQRALARDGNDVVCTASAEGASAALGVDRFDIVVLDLGLPGASGETLCREIRGRDQAQAILVLTAQSAIASRVRCLDAGADDYLTKPFAVAELRARVRALSRRAQGPPPRSFQRGEVSLDFAARRAAVAGSEAPITPREWAILDALAAAGGRVVPRAELLDRAWNRRGEAESASLEVLIGRIRKKLGPEFVRTVRGEGYVLDRE